MIDEVAGAHGAPPVQRSARWLDIALRRFTNKAGLL